MEFNSIKFSRFWRKNAIFVCDDFQDFEENTLFLYVMIKITIFKKSTMKNDFQPQNNFILIKKILNFKKTITNRRFIKKMDWKKL